MKFKQLNGDTGMFSRIKGIIKQNQKYGLEIGLFMKNDLVTDIETIENYLHENNGKFQSDRPSWL